MSNDLGNLGIVIKTLRVEKGLTQDTFAQKLSVTPQAVSKWENGICYPDITMLPSIADVLEVSIEELFGREQKTYKPEPEYAPAEEAAGTVYEKEIEGIPLVYSGKNKGVYSNLKVSSIEGNKVEFEDGSSADLGTSTIINNGNGRIFFAYTEEDQPRRGGFGIFKNFGRQSGKEITREYNGGVIDSINFELAGSVETEILRGSGEGWRMEIKAKESFFDYFHWQEERSCLNVSTKGLMGNIGHVSITLYCGFSEGEDIKLSILGSGSAEIEPSFETSNLRISGSGDVTAGKIGNSVCVISGSGNMELDETGDLNLTISGSGDVHVHQINGYAQTKIAGSGDLEIDSINGNLDTSVSGSGDITVAGCVDSLKLRMSGGGDFNGKGLTADNADISLRGSAEAVIGAVRGRTVENVDRMCRLEIKNRM